MLLKIYLASSSSNKNYKDDETQKAVSCYIHSANILKNYHDKLGIFLDYPLVDNQVFGQSEETIKGGMKKMFLIDILKSLAIFMN